MIKNSIYRMLIAGLFTWFATPALAYQSQDATRIISLASEACKSLQFVEYNTLVEQAGLRVQANIIQEKADVKDAGLGPGRFIAKGDLVMGQDVQPFQFSYDGETFKLHEVGKGDLKKLEDPTPAATGRLLGLFYFNLVSSYLVKPDGLDFLTKGKKEILYVAEEELNDRQVHHLRISSSLSSPVDQSSTTVTSDWYFDSESYLPVKRVVGSYTVMIEFLNTTRPATEIVYDINAATDYAETSVTGQEPNTEGLLSVGDILPDFMLSDAEGETKTFEDVKGQLTIIDFWGTWCGPCLLAMPDLQRLFEKYQGAGLNIVGISVHDKPGKAENYIEKKGYNYQFLVQGDGYARQLKLDTYPTIYIVDENRVVLHAEKGRRTTAKADFEKIIKKHLKLKDHE